MAPHPRRRELPINPYADTPVEQWVSRLQAPGDMEQRYRALLAVTTLLPVDAAWPLVVDLLTDLESELRAAAAHWLAGVSARGTWQPASEQQTRLRSRLEPLLNDDDPDVRLAAAEGLAAGKHLTPEVAATVLSLFQHPETQATSLVTLARLSALFPDVADESVPRLAELLSAEQADLREAAAHALCDLGNRSAAASAELLAALEDEEPLVREFAARTLGQLEFVDDAIRHGLQATVSDEDALVAAAAQESLARLSGLP
jgi:HEAT repeat protein